MSFPLVMRLLVVVLLSLLMSACNANRAANRPPHERAGPRLGIASSAELDVTVVDSTGRPIQGAEVARSFIASTPGFICSKWIDPQAAGFGSMTQTAVLPKATGEVPPVPESRPARGSPLFRDAVEPRSSNFTSYVEGELVRVSIPSNWRELPGANAVTFAPEGAYGNAGIGSAFTHGVEMGLARNDKGDLGETTADFIDSYVVMTRGVGRTVRYRSVTIADRPGLHTVVPNVSEATGKPERIDMFTTLLRDGTLFYVIAIAPRDRARDYARTFRRIVGSIELLDGDRRAGELR